MHCTDTFTYVAADKAALACTVVDANARTRTRTELRYVSAGMRRVSAKVFRAGGGSSADELNPIGQALSLLVFDWLSWYTYSG